MTNMSKDQKYGHISTNINKYQQITNINKYQQI